jgi:hypothetical protein
MLQPRYFFLLPTIGLTLVDWCKVKDDWNLGLGDMWKGVLECRTGCRVMIFGIDAKNLTCWAGCNLVLGEEVGIG